MPLFCFKLVQIILEAVVRCKCTECTPIRMKRL